MKETMYPCSHCGVPIARNLTYCGPCASARREAAIQREVERAERAIDGLTPSRFLATSTDHKEFNARLWHDVQQWHWSPTRPWLGLVGQTGTCKSRCAFLRMRLEPRLFMKDYHFEGDYVPKIRIAKTNGYDFGRLVANRASDDKQQAATAKEELEEIRRADILLIDEIGKIRNTPAIVAEAFALLDYRHAENFATIWTSNTAPSDFCAEWPEKEYAAAACGRLVECSHIITV